jgi:hypothetical protein
MQFTEADRKLLARVKHNHEVWRRFRWVSLALNSAGALACSVLFSWLVLTALRPESEATLRVALLGAPVSFSVALVLTANAAFAIGRWTVPSRELLLRLAEEHEKTKI